jgi:hypothetical protein
MDAIVNHLRFGVATERNVKKLAIFCRKKVTNQVTELLPTVGASFHIWQKHRDNELGSQHIPN